MFRLALRCALCSCLLVPALSFGQAPAALTADPAADAKYPATMISLADLPSHGQMLMGVFYLAAGEAPHPTLILMHGFPGFEQNLDLAQAIRRAGWNVLAVHYRGSWGVKGAFSFQHAIEDADAEVAFVRDPANAKKYRVDTSKIVLLGHSMGGFMVASAAAHDPKVAGVALISAWNIGASFPPASESGGQHSTDEAAKRELMDSFSRDNDTAPLAGCTLEGLVEEAYEHRAAWNFNDYAPQLASRPVLVVTSDDGLQPMDDTFATALKKAGNQQVTEAHFPSDHGYSDHRLALTTVVLKWLATIQ
ncbi:alpha/beta hydrolase family protein [Silvibacterium sp.]|uniref:alpha/beta hydrolase family protein n=1 Tax=Silvibacterium sp. TaxID=1964179 RepID=UPI0039E67DE9